MEATRCTVGVGFPLLENTVKELKKLVARELRNKNQCTHLVNKVEECIQKVKALAGGCARRKCNVVLRAVLHVVMKVQALLEDCAKKDDWNHVAMALVGNVESYRELLEELECVFQVMCSIFIKCNPHENVDDCMGSMDFYPMVGIQLQEDKDLLLQWLRDVSKAPMATEDEARFGQYLCKWIECLQKVEGGELDSMVYPDFPWSRCCLRSLLDKEPCQVHLEMRFQQAGEGGEVFKTKCLGMDCAVKVVEGFEELFRVEAGVLGGLSHPNITKLIGCGWLNDQDVVEGGNLEGDGKEERHFLVMEVLEKSLSRLLRASGTKMSHLVAVDMMLQIARGLCYLHDMKVAHCDLKPENVLVQTLRHPSMDEELVVLKLVDFGMSKINAPRSGRGQFHGKIGTTRYMAPESIACKPGEVAEMSSFSLDVFAFGMMCFEILSSERPFEKEGLRTKKLEEAICGGQRPELPSDCPIDLQTLVEECWSHEPLMRPKCSVICDRLKEVKKKMMEGEGFEMESLNDLRVEPSYGFLFQWLRSVGCVLKSLTRAAYEKIISLRSVFGVSSDSNGTRNEDSYGLQTTKEDYVGIDMEIAKGREELQACKALGLVGMGGIGKSTLAKGILESMQHEYDEHCFLENLKAQLDNLDVVKKVLHDLGKDHGNVRDIQGAWQLLASALRGKKVLIVLDDISNEQVVALKGLQQLDYGKGSKLIITTRDEDILGGFEVDVRRMDVSGLGKCGAREVFAKYANEGGRVRLPYIEDIERKIIEACNGLPLSLEVMGAYLGKEERIRTWERALSRLLRGRTLDVEDRKLWMSLRVSFDTLDNPEKEAFLDISRFFVKGVCPGEMTRSMAMELWGFGDNVSNRSHAVDVLVKRSLLKVDERGCLVMHDQLRDMGCNIVEEDAAHRNTRWEGLTTVTFDAYLKKGAENLQGLSFESCEQYVKGWDEIGHMPLLRIIVIQHCKDLRMVAEILRHSKRIEYFALEIEDARLSLLEQIFSCLAHSNKLCVLEFSCASMELLPIAYGYFNRFPLLRILIMSSCKSLIMLPEAFGNLAALQNLDMGSCGSLTALPETFGNLAALQTLDMRSCGSLTLLPETFGNLAALETLDMGSCGSLVALPEAFGNLTALQSLHIFDCERLTALPETFGNLAALQTLDIGHCGSLIALPETFGNLVALQTLDMKYCEVLALLPETFGNLVALQTLDMKWCRSLTALPKTFGNLTALQTLDMRCCESLTLLPETFGNLATLQTLDLMYCESLTLLSNTFGNLAALQTVDMATCRSLTSLPETFGNLVALQTLDLRCCGSLIAFPETFGNLAALSTLDMGTCGSLTALPETFGNLTALQSLNMGSCRSLTTLPETFGNLGALQTLAIGCCGSLTTLPETFGNLTALETLGMESCGSLTLLPKTLGSLTALQTLYMGSCGSLTALPETFGNLVALHTLSMSYCESLTTLPETFGNLAALHTLNMSYCKSLITLPETFGNLSALQTLDMSFCDILIVLPETFGNLVTLCTLDMGSCGSLTALPETFGNLAALQTLDIGHCGSLIALPETFGNLTTLQTLHIIHCECLTALPETFGNLGALQTLDIGCCGSLTALPETFGNLTALQTLDMGSFGSLIAVPETFGNLAALQTLDMGSCESLTLLPETFGNLAALQSLDMGSCGSLTALPEAFGNLSTLQTLHIFDCERLTTLSETFGNLAALQTLHIYDCEFLTVLPETFGNLAALQTLAIGRCGSLTALPRAFGNLAALQTLHIFDFEGLLVLPETFGNLAALQTLDIGCCGSLTLLPETFGNLAALQTLDMGSCGSLIALPKAFGNLTALQSLHIFDCEQLTALPETFGNLAALQTLNIGRCGSLTALPGAFGNLAALQALHITDCKGLVVLPETFGNLAALQTLDIGRCGSLIALPETFGNLVALQTLDMKYCEVLVLLPETFGNLATLQTLDMGSCGSLTALPVTFGNLTALQTLNIGCCGSLTALPETFGNLTALQTLDMGSCGSLTMLPETFGNLSALKSLT